MEKNNINVSEIETFIESIFRSVISNQVYADDIPNSISDDWKDMVIFDCSNIHDNDALGTGFILVYLYARPLSDGSKNVKTMSAMEKALNTAIAATSNGTYRLSRSDLWTDFDARCKWHTNVVKLNITIV